MPTNITPDYCEICGRKITWYNEKITFTLLAFDRQKITIGCKICLRMTIEKAFMDMQPMPKTLEEARKIYGKRFVKE